MRRAPVVLTATVLGTAGVLLFRPLPVAALTSASSSSGTAATTTGSATAGSSTDGSSSGVTATVTGSAIETRFGVTQVKVTVKNGRITAVTAVKLNDYDGRSYEISESAEPTLRQEVLSAQTAAVDTVSGATYTSLSYEASLQSALDEAGFAAADGSKASTDAPAVEGH